LWSISQDFVKILPGKSPSLTVSSSLAGVLGCLDSLKPLLRIVVSSPSAIRSTYFASRMNFASTTFSQSFLIEIAVCAQSLAAKIAASKASKAAVGHPSFTGLHFMQFLAL